ncbi:MAG: response regulator [Candidatus Zixiibacteriota bacterium]
MGEFNGYIGIAIVIVISAAAIITVSKFGLNLRKFKHGNTELDFDPKSTNGDRGALKIKSIIVLPLAEKDCVNLGISSREAVEFIKEDAKRHPDLFAITFTSVPLIFQMKVLLLSWDGLTASIERIIERDKAYPLNDVWSSCLSQYRKATQLRYRVEGSNAFLRSAELKKTLKQFLKLTEDTQKLLETAATLPGLNPPDFNLMLSILEEAETASFQDDWPTCISKLEGVLSSVHKILIDLAPDGTAKSPQNSNIALGKKRETTELQILVADDQEVVHFLIPEILELLLKDRPHNIVKAYNGREALLAMVEREFDLIFVDIRMPYKDEGGFDGTELLLTAKKSSPQTRVILISGYDNLIERAKTDSQLSISDWIICKPFKIDEIRTVLQAFSLIPKSKELSS